MGWDNLRMPGVETLSTTIHYYKPAIPGGQSREDSI